MIKSFVLWCAALMLAVASARADVLMVADEFPAMQILAAKLKAEEHLESKIISQKELPARLSDYSAVIVYIHKALDPAPERAFIKYAQEGGKLIVLHHSISSGKRTNDLWLSFLGVSLPTGDVTNGGYKWVEPATIDVVNLNPAHFITTHKVQYPSKLEFSTPSAGRESNSLPGFQLPDSEAYLNQVHTGPHTLLLGLSYRYPVSGVLYQQTTAGWLKQVEKGMVIYLMPGHRKEDFEDSTYSRIVLNAVIFQP